MTEMVRIKIMSTDPSFIFLSSFKPKEQKIKGRTLVYQMVVLISYYCTQSLYCSRLHSSKKEIVITKLMMFTFLLKAVSTPARKQGKVLPPID
uniref:Ubiquitin thioesterase OTU1-like isoform X2 n=1 Tax=Rhizophora mucronata TaxID=61149 RepID=A0A2P2LV41_RHIMU